MKSKDSVCQPKFVNQSGLKTTAIPQSGNASKLQFPGTGANDPEFLYKAEKKGRG